LSAREARNVVRDARINHEIRRRYQRVSEAWGTATDEMRQEAPGDLDEVTVGDLDTELARLVTNSRSVWWRRLTRKVMRR
jgi:hypothetical protein